MADPLTNLMATHKGQLFLAALSIMLATMGILTIVKLSRPKLVFTGLISNQVMKQVALIGFIYSPVRLVITRK